MTDQPTEQPAAQPPPLPGNPQHQAQAAQAVGAVQQPDQGTDAGQSIEEMQSQAVRAALSDFEKQLQDQMAAARSQFAQQQKTIEALTRQLDTVRAQAGPPDHQKLADSLATRVQSIAAANPDLGAQHFAGVITQAGNLAAEVADVAAGKTSPDRAAQLASGIAAWFSRVHPRISGKFLEGAHAALDEAERIAEAVAEIAPAASAVARVL